ncbi:FG-GAP repeat domain-containing protein [Singulisphaera acidiphila]|uniref:FG-GAP repeat protein n=1 Tax=Singulisphaera acidiphila (strain ATCC BAA-1392 / DSM 18658 / VKM B-2454 / MOB10) TaxID=886293 RepID=L0DS23_SINAD|nr:VCBS repeat-containing protein [Singulisphaera acidiphila]AGA31201.1 FG-GAP repeat protein [Singulisphaera acidiphila DSM 18658]
MTVLLRSVEAKRQSVMPERVRPAGRQVRRDRQRAPGLEVLETRNLLSGLLVGGAGAGGVPIVQVFDADTGAERFQFPAYNAKMTAGVRVAVGDVNGDGELDIVTAPGPGGPAIIKVFRASDGTQIGQFAAPRTWSRGGTWVASGDVNGDGQSEIIVAPGLGAPMVRVYQGLDGQLLDVFRANAGGTRRSWGQGAKVAVGDLDQDGYADIVALSAFGPSKVHVLDGQSGSLLADYTAFAGPSRGKTSVAVGKIGSDRHPDLIVASAPPRSTQTRVKVYQGIADANPAEFVVPNSSNGGGVEIAAVNLGGRGRDELALAPTRGGGLGLGATILSRTPLLSLTSPQGAASLTVAYRLPTAVHGLFLAGDNTGALSTAAVAANAIEPPLSQALPVIQRLAYFDPTLKQFVPVQPDDPRLVGKDITVISHGWAPGYQGWVNYEANVKNHVLKWWETDPSQPGYDSSWTSQNPQGPASDWLLHGETVSTIFGTTEVSATGLAQAILSRTNSTVPGSPTDPNAAVLAYSWIDDSATPTWNVLDTKIPEDAYKSEALTTLNGARLASALESVLGTSFTGKLQLVGHSHGSKVVSVASAALQQAKMRVDQVTILDSPEDDVTVAGDAANFNWYFLKNLSNLNRSSPVNTFVENYISEFNVPYSGLQLSNGQGQNLNQIVDVGLTPDIYYSYDLGGRHGYAASWYTGSSDPNLTYQQTVGQYWSPLLPANSGASNPVKNLSPYYEQNWDDLFQPADQQFVLEPQTAAPSETITFQTYGTAPVSVTQNGTISQSQPISLRAPLRGQSGIAFDYQFPTYQPGDRLIILADGDVAFVMDAALVGSSVAHATLSLSGFPLETHSLTFILTSTTSNQTSKVVVSNFQTFYQPLL